MRHDHSSSSSANGGTHDRAGETDGSVTMGKLGSLDSDVDADVDLDSFAALEKLVFRENRKDETSKTPTRIRKRTRRRRRNGDLPDQDHEATSAEIRQIETAIERSNFAHSVLVKPPQPYAHPGETHESLRRHHKAVSAQVYHDRHRKNIGAVAPDWRKVLETMAQYTPAESTQWIEDGMEIRIAESTLDSILHGVGDAKIGAIRRRTGAAVKVSRGKPGTLLVSGTRSAINRATDELRHIAGKMSITRRYSPLAPGEVETETLDYDERFFTPPLSRDEGARGRPVNIRHHVYATVAPVAWTPRALEEYVATLVDSRLADRSLHALLYKTIRGDTFLDHERAVVRRLLRVFQMAPARAVASCSAFKLALAYMTARGDKYLPAARRLFVLMERRGLVMDADVFNILLRAPVRTRDLRKFHQTLRMMTQGKGHAPNLDTWILFLRLVKAPEVRAYILRTMHLKNLLGGTPPLALEPVAKAMAALDAEHTMRQPGGFELAAFLRAQEERYGPAWVTRHAGNQVLDVLGRHGLYGDAFAFLDVMASAPSAPSSPSQEGGGDVDGATTARCPLRGRPDAVSFNTLIAHAKARGKMPLAVNVLRKMKRRATAKQPDAETLRLLFEMAWTMRLRCAVVVVWRYAALARATTFGMRSRVEALFGRRIADAAEPEAEVGNEDPEANGENEEEMKRKNENHSDVTWLSASTYRELGGETLARELAGGRRALAFVRRETARLFGGGDGIDESDGDKGRGSPTPPRKMATFAAKGLECAFGRALAPGAALGAVLAQAVLADLRCLRARKEGRLGEVLAGARVRGLVLRRRRAGQEGWVDVAPLEGDGEEDVRPGDVWEDRWESEGWDGAGRAVDGVKGAAGGRDADPQRGHFAEVPPLREAAAAGAAAPEEMSAGELPGPDHLVAHKKVEEGSISKRLVVINPHVWADEAEAVAAAPDDDDDDKNLDGGSGKRSYHTELQRQNEEDVLVGLEEMAKSYRKIRYVWTDDKETEEEASGDWSVWEDEKSLPTNKQQ